MGDETFLSEVPMNEELAPRPTPAARGVVRAARVPARFVRWLELAERPALAALLALAVYLLLAWRQGSLLRRSTFAYFNYLADAFVHGQLHLRLVPEVALDLSQFEGRYYLYWPPLPAALLTPFVALFGVGFSDVLFTVAVAAVNVAVVALVLRQACRRGVVDLSPAQRGLLVLVFAFGTVHITLAPYASVWATGQLVGFLMVALGYLAALSLRGPAAFALAGLAFACAMLTRNHLILAGLWPAYYLLRTHRDACWGALARWSLAGALPVVVGLGLFAGYNWLRFGSVFDNGLAYHQMDDRFRAEYERYGAFNVHYLPTNLFYQYLAYPLPPRETTFFGGSLFLLTPVFFAAAWAFGAARERTSALVLLATILLVATPILLLMGTGWTQFGPRYTLDFTVPLLLLTALGLRRWPLWLAALLGAASAAQYLAGTLLLGEVVR
jgi:hypothetical protein